MSLAANARGDVVAAWNAQETPGVDISVPTAALRPTGGAWTTARRLTPPGIPGSDSRAAIDDAGDAVVVWAGDGIHAAAYDQAGPAMYGLAMPAAATARFPVSFAVNPLDTWSGVSAVSWDFGDGQTSNGPAPSRVFARSGRYTVQVVATDGKANGSTRSQVISVAPAPAPAAITGPARRVSRSSAALTATVNPRGQNVSYHFEWGRTARYGRRTKETALPANTVDRRVSRRLRKLVPGTIYHHRIVATYCDGCAEGTTYGADASFRTLPPKRVLATINWDVDHGPRYTVFNALELRHVPRGGRIRLRCDGPCGRSRLSARGRGTVALTSLDSPASSSSCW